MKICHYLPSLNLNDGGPPRSVSFICKELALSGIEITILTSQKDLSNDIEISPLIRRINLLEKDDIKQFFTINNFDIVHTHGIWLINTHYINNLVKSLGMLLIVSPRGMLERWAFNHKRFKKFIAWHLYQRDDLNNVNAFHATAHSEYLTIKKKGFKQKIYSIPNGVYTPSITLDKNNLLRNKNVLFLSRINKKKGLDHLLEAWARINPKGWTLQIAGNDDDGTINSIKQRIKHKDLMGRVELLGSLNEEKKVAAYLKAGLFILPSHSENFGIVVAEALSYGIPVITTKGCPWEALEKFDCGWWIDLDIESITNALSEYILSTTDQRKVEMSGNAISLVNTKFKWESIAKSFINMYEEQLEYKKININE